MYTANFFSIALQVTDVVVMHTLDKAWEERK